MRCKAARTFDQEINKKKKKKKTRVKEKKVIRVCKEWSIAYPKLKQNKNHRRKGCCPVVTILDLHFVPFSSVFFLDLYFSFFLFIFSPSFPPTSGSLGASARAACRSFCASSRLLAFSWTRPRSRRARAESGCTARHDEHIFSVVALSSRPNASSASLPS